MAKTLSRVDEFVHLADRVQKILGAVDDEGMNWETAYSLIFSDEISVRLRELGMNDYYDPDMDYSDDVMAFATALEEQAAQYRKMQAALTKEESCEHDDEMDLEGWVLIGGKWSEATACSNVSLSKTVSLNPDGLVVTTSHQVWPNEPTETEVVIPHAVLTALLRSKKEG